MKKWIIVGLIGAVALVAVVKKTNMCSYAGTLWTQVSAGAKDQVPTKFELERIRHEIAGLDNDISEMLRPIAEHEVAIKKLRKDIAKSEKNIDERKKNLLAVVEELEAGKAFVINDRPFTPEQVRKQLQRDTESLKQVERHVKVQQQIMEAKEQAFKATKDQLAKVISKKRDYEIRLAQLEADEETLQVARIGSNFNFDNSRATQIEDALAAVEARQETEKKIAELKANELATINLQERTRTPADLNSIRAYLQGSEPADKSASNK